MDEQMTSTERDLMATVALVLYLTGETQRELAAAIGLGQAQISRRQAGVTPWSVADLDRLSRHWAIPVPDLVAGPEHAARRLPASRRAQTLGGTQTTIPAP